MKTIALFDFHQGGHHLTYLKVFSQNLLDMGHRVILCCQEIDEVIEWLTIYCPDKTQNLYTVKIQKPVLPFFFISKMRQIFMVLAQWKYAAKVIKQASSNFGYSPDLVFFPWLDSYFSDYLNHHIIDFIFPYNWSGLYFHPVYLKLGHKFLPFSSIPLKYYNIARSPRCIALAFLDEIEGKKIQQEINKNIICFPDFTDDYLSNSDYPIVQKIKEKAGSRKIVGLFGSLCKRKGMLTLMDVACQLEDDNYFFVFIGSLSTNDLLPQEVDKISEIVESSPSNCFFNFERIADEQEFNALINSCDILFAAYINFPYSSNILTKAAVFEKPVIVSDGFCMSERVKQFNLGVSIPEGNTSKTIEALSYLSKQIDVNLPDIKRRFDAYRKIHSTEELRDKLSNICHSLDKYSKYSEIN